MDWIGDDDARWLEGAVALSPKKSWLWVEIPIVFQKTQNNSVSTAQQRYLVIDVERTVTFGL
jgi:hypothetical protein